MCYKDERYKKLANILSEKMVNAPRFVCNYFTRYKSEASKVVYWGYIENMLQWLCANCISVNSISEITPELMNQVTSIDIINYLNSLKNGVNCVPNTLNTIGTKKNVLSAFWSYLVEQKLVDENIIKQIPGHLYKSEITNHVVKIPTEDQLENFMKKLEQGNGNDFDCSRNMAIVQLFLGSGIRSEELIGLDVSDLYLDGVCPYIMILDKGKREIKDKVFISLKAKYYLEDYLIKRDEFITKHGLEDENALFLSNRKNRISKTPIAEFFKSYSDGQINPHMLRHWVGTEIYQKTKDIILVQKQLRHRLLEKAIEYYVPVENEDLAYVILYL